MPERFQLTDSYSISRVINGCWQLSQGHSFNQLDMNDVRTAFHRLVDSGFTTFDCADIYTGAEEFLGSFLAERSTSNTADTAGIQVHTKFVPDIHVLETVDLEYTEGIIDRSLRRLHRETLDLVQFHWWDYSIKRYVDTAGYLKRLQDKGKIRFIGVTNFDTARLKELVDAGIPILSCQSQYSLFDRRPEKELLDYCRSQGIHHFCYGTLAGGLLTQRYVGKKDLEPETRSQVKYLQVIEETLGLEGYQRLLQLLHGIAQRHNAEIPHVATRYILDQPGVAASIIGVRNSRHAASNSRIFDISLSAEDVIEIQQFLEAYPVLEGEPFELERTPGSKFRNIMKMKLNQE